MDCSWGSLFCVNELFLNQKKTAPEAVVHALWTAVFLWVVWFISGYGTPVSKTVQPHDYIGEKLPNRSLYKRVSSKIPSLFLPFRNCRTFLCSHCRTGSSLVETVPTRSTVTGTLTRNVTDVTRRKKMKGIFEKLRYSTYSPSQESSRANFEPKVYPPQEDRSFCESKKFRIKLQQESRWPACR